MLGTSIAFCVVRKLGGPSYPIDGAQISAIRSIAAGGKQTQVQKFTKA
jgi:hypothetical protein